MTTGGIGGLLRRLVEDVLQLVRSEIGLMMAEMQHNAKGMGKAAGLVAAGGGLILMAGSVLTVALISWLATLVGLIAACLIVGIAALVGGGLLVMQGVASLRRTDLAPRRALAHVKDTAKTLEDAADGNS